jgi:hypothetical protein
MVDLSHREEYPLWVRLSLLGSPSRAAVWFWFWLCLAGAAVTAGLAAWLAFPWLYAGLVWLPAALLYWSAIRWVDAHGRW